MPKIVYTGPETISQDENTKVFVRISLSHWKTNASGQNNENPEAQNYMVVHQRTNASHYIAMITF